MAAIHHKRKKGQELLINVFLKLHNEDNNYFKMYEKYGINVEKSIFNEAIKKTKNENEIVSWENPLFSTNYSTLFRKVIANITYTPAAEELIERLKNKEFPPNKNSKYDPR